MAEEEAEPLYLRSLEEFLGATTVRTDLTAPTFCMANGCVDSVDGSTAREQLRIAHELFTAIGAEAFAERRVELLATGERRLATSAAKAELTPQEAQVARLAAEGGTNRRSPVASSSAASTVDYHLRKVYPKLGVTSRHQLAQALRT